VFANQEEGGIEKSPNESGNDTNRPKHKHHCGGKDPDRGTIQLNVVGVCAVHRGGAATNRVGVVTGGGVKRKHLSSNRGGKEKIVEPQNQLFSSR